MNPKILLSKLTDWFDVRPQAERFIIAGIGLGGLIYLFVVMMNDPAQQEIASLDRQLTTVQTRLLEQQTNAAELQLSGVEDPDSFIRERLASLIEAQSLIQGDIESLAGNLVSPNGMTQMLTEVLDSQEGLTLIKVENVAPEALTNGMTVAPEGVSNGRASVRSIGFQVFRHGLVLEFQGDYFSTLRYLLYLEAMDESFFWDSFEFEQTLWPEARMRLELHTLSSEEGFIGV
jgi:MSHA biogenesis protein MshJ